MILNIENDLNRFKKIVRGRVREDLKRYMSSGELIGKQGDKLVSIPLPEVRIPRIRYGENQTGGVGQGEGEEGEAAEGGDGGKAGNAAGQHILEAEISLEELAEIIESAASCQVFSVLKRPDEKWVTEEAYENPKFVEDIVQRPKGGAGGAFRPRPPLVIHSTFYISFLSNFEFCYILFLYGTDNLYSISTSLI